MSIFDYAAIDPLALIFPSSVYVRLVEKLHPHVPKVAEIKEAAKGMTAEERSFVLAKAKAMVALGQAVEEALK
jgi:hypothetical protein